MPGCRFLDEEVLFLPWVAESSGMLLLGGGCESNQELPGACTAPICFFVKMDGMNVSNLQYRIAE